MEDAVCGAITRKGGHCQNRNGANCPYHTDDQRARRYAELPTESPVRPRGAASSSRENGIADRDLHAVAWRLLEDLLEDDRVDAARRASAGATLIRVVEALGEPPVSRERAAAEIALRGMVMHGMPPRNAEEWALAEELFTPPPSPCSAPGSPAATTRSKCEARVGGAPANPRRARDGALGCPSPEGR